MRRVRDTHSGVRLIVAVVCILLLVTPGVVFAATLDYTTPGAEVTGRTRDERYGVQATPGPSRFPLNGEHGKHRVENITTIPTTPVPPFTSSWRTRPMPSTLPRSLSSIHRSLKT